MKKYVCICLLAGCLFMLNGCVSNRAIKEFAATSIEATNHLPSVANDLSESCIRQKQYLAVRAGNFDPLQLRKNAENQCISFQSSEKSFVVANKVIIQYLQTLDKLAGDDIITYDKSLDKLASNLGETALFPKEKVKAINGIVKLLSDASANGWRRKKLGKAIGSANPNIQLLLSTLSTIITSDYQQLLQNEQLAAKNLYLGTIKENKTKEPVTIILLQQQWDKEYKLLEDRKDRVNVYSDILKTIAQGHQLLFDKQTSLNKKEVKRDILDYTSKIVPLISEVNDTF
ncbi:hypothetical protein [Spirosoma flavum]|uniref:Lipoprotein n=1 Tax=Spirosoma flavum TaxID=2048557 RepID=A0ABW6AMI6_9BACT